MRLPALRHYRAALASAAAASVLPNLPLQPHATADARASARACIDEGEDPNIWLENVEGKDALDWCRAQNSRSTGAIGDPKSTPAYSRILAIADSKDKIPHVGRIGGVTGDDAAAVWYNFWQDAENVRGVWRRTSLGEYRKGSPAWETVLSLDQLNKAEARKEGEEFVWHGYDLLDEGPARREWDRCLVFLSPGGTDAQVAREFDLTTKKFVEGGFETTKAEKCDVGFRTRDEVLIGTDFGDGKSFTDSGYPRVIKSWIRGTPLSEAKTVFEVENEDIGAHQYAYHDRGHVHEFQLRSKSFYASEQWHRSPDLKLRADQDKTPFRKVPVPDDTRISTFGDQATLLLRSEWSPPNAPGKRSYPAGTLLSAPLGDVMSEDWSKVPLMSIPNYWIDTEMITTDTHVQATALFEPAADGSKALQHYAGTRNYLVLETSEHVVSSLEFWRRDQARGWVKEERKGKGEVGVTVGARAIWPDDSDEVWLTRTGFLEPSSLSRANANDGCATSEPFKSLPAQFDAKDLACTQHFATSKDGTKVPYFQLGPKEMKLDGSHPTLLDGYGGFEISLEPGYSGSVGAAWLERGGVKAIANIRGGGEYGPRWHQAALREKRQRAYEDFEAIGRDLISRGVTKPEKLGAIGGSNGGLLMGNMLTREGRGLFGAIVCQVPLLDMLRYHTLLAGASWMEEYGNPDEPGVWEGHLRAISPYHRLKDCLKEGSSWPGCPRVLFTTSTKDDRVHPGHARKMVKALLDGGVPESDVLYWENIEGGHGGAADNKQRAYMWALSYNFLWQTLAEAAGAKGEDAAKSAKAG